MTTAKSQTLYPVDDAILRDYSNSDVAMMQGEVLSSGSPGQSSILYSSRVTF